MKKVSEKTWKESPKSGSFSIWSDNMETNLIQLKDGSFFVKNKQTEQVFDLEGDRLVPLDWLIDSGMSNHGVKVALPNLYNEYRQRLRERKPGFLRKFFRRLRELFIAQKTV